MENEKSLFDLQLDMLGRNHLKEAAKWARFLAIIGFIGLGLIFIISLIVSVNSNNKPSYDDYGHPVATGAEVVGSILGALMIVGLYFFPCYFLLKFSNKMSTALESDNIASLNESFKNLKVTFRYLGIVTIIFLLLVALGFLTELTSKG